MRLFLKLPVTNENIGGSVGTVIFFVMDGDMLNPRISVLKGGGPIGWEYPLF